MQQDSKIFRCGWKEQAGINILAFSTSPGGGDFLSKLKNREEFERGLEKEKEKGGKEENKEKSDKTHVKIPLWSLNTAKKSTKTGKNFSGGGGRIFLAGQIIYPCVNVWENMHLKEFLILCSVIMSPVSLKQTKVILRSSGLRLMSARLPFPVTWYRASSKTCALHRAIEWSKMLHLTL